MLKTPLIALAREAGTHIMDVYLEQRNQFSLKKDGSYVTEADRRAEKYILSNLLRLTPEITIISEENSASHTIEVPERFWLVDPLDGTKEFLKKNGQGTFTVNIALIEHQNPVLGIIFLPAINRLFYGDIDTGAWEITEDLEQLITASNVRGQKRCAVTSSSHIDVTTVKWLHNRGITQIKPLSSSIKFCALAAGEADIYPRFNSTMEWDTAAGDAILRAAGGITTTLEFEPLSYGKAGYRNQGFIAWNKALEPFK
ncbi:MAG: 3'(2'),5'-bisphosphate nucleotidase CysQ [Hyphomicrobiaceae bacterium hypho_1]